MTRLAMVCEHCGSPNVRRDAWAEWSIDTQRWELGDVFDYAYCDDCAGDAHIVEVDAATVEHDEQED